MFNRLQFNVSWQPTQKREEELRNFLHSVMVHLLIAINMLFVYCGFALAQSCTVSSKSQNVVLGEHSVVFVEVTATSGDNLISAYGMDFSRHDWERLWELRAKAEADCERFIARMDLHPKGGRKLNRFLDSLDLFGSRVLPNDSICCPPQWRASWRRLRRQMVRGG